MFFGNNFFVFLLNIFIYKSFDVWFMILRLSVVNKGVIGFGKCFVKFFFVYIIFCFGNIYFGGRIVIGWVWIMYNLFFFSVYFIFIGIW